MVQPDPPPTAPPRSSAAPGACWRRPWWLINIYWSMSCRFPGDRRNCPTFDRRHRPAVETGFNHCPVPGIARTAGDSSTPELGSRVRASRRRLCCSSDTNRRALPLAAERWPTANVEERSRLYLSAGITGLSFAIHWSLTVNTSSPNGAASAIIARRPSATGAGGTAGVPDGPVCFTDAGLIGCCSMSGVDSGGLRR